MNKLTDEQHLEMLITAKNIQKLLLTRGVLHMNDSRFRYTGHIIGSRFRDEDLCYSLVSFSPLSQPAGWPMLSVEPIMSSASLKTFYERFLWQN